MWESGPWKLELLRMMDRCERQYQQMSLARDLDWFQEAVQAQQLEKAVFLSAFIVRKLIESERLSVQAEDASITVEAYPIRDEAMAPDRSNWDRLDKFYDLEAPTQEVVPLRHLVNWIIHSFVFIPEVRSDRAGSEVVTAYYCNSDRLRSTRVVRVPWQGYRALLRMVASDDVTDVIFVRDGHGKQVQLRSAIPVTRQMYEDFRSRHAAFIEEAHRRAWEDYGRPRPKR